MSDVNYLTTLESLSIGYSQVEVLNLYKQYELPAQCFHLSKFKLINFDIRGNAQIEEIDSTDVVSTNYPNCNSILNKAGQWFVIFYSPFNEDGFNEGVSMTLDIKTGALIEISRYP